MSEDSRIKKFFRHIWYELEPIVTELVVFAVVIFLFYFVGNYTKPYLDEKLKEAVDIIKWIVIVSALSLFAFHTIIRIIIRMVVGIFHEGKEAYDEIKTASKDETLSNENVEEKQSNDLLLNPKSANFDESENVKDKNLDREADREGQIENNEKN